MKARCANPNHKAYYNYGGRGIKVCDEWVYDFNKFLSDMGPRPSKKHSLERGKNDLGYSKSNCSWETAEVQSRNKRNNRVLTYGDRTMIMEDWATFFRIDQSSLHEQLERKPFVQVYEYYLDKMSKRGLNLDNKYSKCPKNRVECPN
jgi:hypothetical protein